MVARLAPLLLIVAGLLAYANTWNMPFVRDDVGSIVENQTLRPPWALQRLMVPPGHGATVQARPVLNMSFAANYALHGLERPGYHATNIAIHLLGGLTLLGLSRRILRRCSRIPALDIEWVALFIALLWTLHPLQTEAVTYIVQRAESLAGLLYLFTLYALFRAATAPRANANTNAAAPGARVWTVAAVTCCAMGMATKETLISAPIMALLFDRAFLSTSWTELWRARARTHVALMATWSVQGALLVTQGRLAYEETAGGLEATPWQYLLTQTGILLHYLTLAFTPTSLCFDLYDWPVAKQVTEVLPATLTLLTLFGLAVWLLVRRPPLGFLALWPFAILAPSSSILPLADIAVEHRMYLPLATIVAGSVLGLYTVVRQMRMPLARRALWLSLSLLAAWAAALTRFRNQDYESHSRLWSDTAAKRPLSARAHYHSAWADYDLGAMQRAKRAFSRTIELDPLYSVAYYGRAMAHDATGQAGEAIADLDRALTTDAGNPLFYNARGRLHEKANRLPLALADYSAAIAAADDFAPAYRNRSRLQLQRGQPAAALEDINTALRLDGSRPHDLAVRANILSALGRLDEALGDYDRAIAAGVDDAETYYNRANARARMEDFAGALLDFDAAIQRRADFGEAINNRASVRFIVGKVHEAAADLATCERLGFPPNPELVGLVQAAIREASP